MMRVVIYEDKRRRFAIPDGLEWALISLQLGDVVIYPDETTDVCGGPVEIKTAILYRRVVDFPRGVIELHVDTEEHAAYTKRWGVKDPEGK